MPTDNSIEKRITDMYNALGYNTQDPFISAEIAAYSKGLNMIEEKILYAAAEMNPYTAENEGLEYFCELMSVDPALSSQERIDAMIKKITTQYGDYGFGEMKNVFRTYTSKVQMSMKEKTITFQNLDSECFDLLPKIGNLIETYVLPPITVFSTGNGCTFEMWDSTPYCFEDYDSFNCPFSLLETIIPATE
ncbi:MAG: hypothetical protein ACI4IQ_07070 [Eubacterium sp.]